MPTSSLLLVRTPLSRLIGDACSQNCKLQEAACSLGEHPCWRCSLAVRAIVLQQQPALAVGKLVPTHAKIGMLSQLPASLGPSCLGCPKNLNFGQGRTQMAPSGICLSRLVGDACSQNCKLQEAACSLGEHPCWRCSLAVRAIVLQQQPALAVGKLVPTHAKIGMLSQLPASLGPSCLGCPKNLNFG